MANPKLVELRDLLLDKSKWPDGFEWNYSTHCGCVIGLAEQSGILVDDDIDWPEAAQTTFGLSSHTLDDIYVGIGYDKDHYVATSMRRVTPEIAAAFLTDLINKQD